MVEVIKTDLLVIGGGIAGCLAAIQARSQGAEVLLVDKAQVGRSGYSHQMSGVLTYFDPQEDTVEAWYRECIEAGQGLVDRARLEGMVEETTACIQDLARWGVEFQIKEGKFIRTPGVGHSHARNVLMTFGGFQMMAALRGEVLRRGVKLRERVMLTDLLTSDGLWPTTGQICGAVGFNIRNAEPMVIRAKALILATGALDTFYLKAPSLSGDGKFMAFRVGCTFRNLELSFTTLKPVNVDCGPGINVLFGEGARLVNKTGERFLSRWDPARMENAPRVILGRAIATEYAEGRGPVFIDARHLSEESLGRIEKSIPIIIRSLERAKINLRRDLIEYTALIADYGPGGIRVNPEGRTSVPALWAAGAVTDHGEDGVTNILTHGIEAAIGGQRAGRDAARQVFHGHPPQIVTEQLDLALERIRSPLNRRGRISLNALNSYYRELAEAVGILRNRRKLEQAIRRVAELQQEILPNLSARDGHELMKVLGAEHAMLHVDLQARAALRREESRGAHFRTDFPERNDQRWLLWIIAKNSGQGVTLEEETVPWR